MLQINAIGRICKGTVKKQLENGTINYVVPVLVEVPYKSEKGIEYQKTLLNVPIWRKEENIPEFELNAKVGAVVSVGMNMPFAVSNTKEDGSVYGSFSCKKVNRFLFLGEKSEHYIDLLAVGNLTADAKISDLKSDENRKAINFSVACNMREKDKEGNPVDFAVFVNCGMFREAGKTSIADYIRKGGKIVAEGRPVVRTSINEQGKPVAYFNAEIYQIEFVGKLPESETRELPEPPFDANQPTGNSLVNSNDDLPF